MRPITLALFAAVAVAGCGGDEPASQDAATTPRPAPEQPPADPAVDTGVPTPRADAPGAATADSGTPGGPVGAPAGSVASTPLYTVQVAAFTESTSAIEWARRLRAQELPVWTSMVELGGRTFYRVRVGAVPTVSEARRLGSMITQRYEWPVWVAPVTPADRVPDDAPERTRRLLQGG
jgi:septal ring-binding cell division protein DamX